MARDRELYRETYKKGAAVIRESLLPDRLPYMPEGWRITKMELIAAGKKELTSGEVVEYQEVRVYVTGSSQDKPDHWP